METVFDNQLILGFHLRSQGIQAEDHKVGAFSGLGEEDVCVGFPPDGSFDVCNSIHVVCSNGFGKTL